MKKLLLVVALAALALPPPGAPARAESDVHHEFTADDLAAFTDARIAALKAGLKLDAAQEKHWPAIETQLHDMAKARTARIAEWRQWREKNKDNHDALEMLRRRSALMSARGAELGKLADAAAPLYASLDAAQKQRFDLLLRQVFKGMHHGFGWRHRDHDD